MALWSLYILKSKIMEQLNTSTITDKQYSQSETYNIYIIFFTSHLNHTRLLYWDQALPQN